MVAVAEPQQAPPQVSQPGPQQGSRPIYRSKALIAGGIVLAWLVLWLVFRNVGTLSLDASALTPLHRWINSVNDAVGASRNSNPLFLYFFNEIRFVIDEFVTFVQALIAQPSFGRPVPVIGWLGVVAIAGFVSLVVAGWRVALLAVAGFVFLGLQGLWQESMDTLSLTLAAVVISLLFGIPLGVWAGLSDRAHRVITPVLDFMQTMPTFVYLAPLTLFFLIGPASATIATLIYAAPPAIRITAHAIRSVPHNTVEASESLGATWQQTLVKVLLPSARKTIVLGINQTIMAALSMVTIAALIDAPGLGKTVVKALQTLDVGTAFNAGLAIVVLAIVLDRVTTAATERRKLPRWAMFGGLGVTGVAVYLSYTYLWAAEFQSDVEIGSSIRQGATAVTEWVQDSLPVITGGFKDFVTLALINPLQALLAESPWFVVALVIVAFSFLIGGLRPAVVSAVCLGLLVATGLWQDSMITLASTLVATILVMVLGVVVGVWMGRSRRADRVIRPVLDAGQVMPAFVYLVPFLALFSASRFTAIIAAVVFAAPVAIKIIADGVRAVSPATVEAATALGSSSWQTIVKVQLPMARRALTLAANQGLIYVLSMVVVGGLVGAGALGYDVVAGFSQGQLYGKGLAAGVAIVVLGVMLDRLTQAAAKRWTN
ncbi:glycine betaine/proline transport system permease protein [Lentzea atacamensis]|uniref:Glycine betaine/proline transport system permease protein n=2 Tax=Lentzea TaxID=165301 RepID=A0A316HVE9_9PSEU|nr:ABC transporter permease subunit [Lentzea atacamensis]PWK82301.1 glycine betaine/proline transport system permease protein [Lentzea atacamensis]RAS64607.1 glycine betaine/proline transport system permease protein [Lentzea atacamensis]